MPDQVGDTTDPYTTSNQWSRRFIGLKLFLTLLTAGRSGYAADRARRRAGRGPVARLGREQLDDREHDPAAGRLHRRRDRPDDADFHGRIVDDIVASGRAWISTTVLRGRPAIRINVISHRTTERHIDQFVGWLAQPAAGHRRPPRPQTRLAGPDPLDEATTAPPSTKMA